MTSAPRSFVNMHEQSTDEDYNSCYSCALLVFEYNFLPKDILHEKTIEVTYRKN